MNSLMVPIHLGLAKCENIPFISAVTASPVALVVSVAHGVSALALFILRTSPFAVGGIGKGMYWTLRGIGFGSGIVVAGSVATVSVIPYQFYRGLLSLSGQEIPPFLPDYFFTCLEKIVKFFDDFTRTCSYPLNECSDFIIRSWEKICPFSNSMKYLSRAGAMSIEHGFKSLMNIPSLSTGIVYMDRFIRDLEMNGVGRRSSYYEYGQ